MRKNIYLSAGIGLLEELVAIISGLILPRLILLYFGSTYNGLISAVTQFIGCIALLKSGIGMATKVALYEPLYNKDKKKIDGIMAATMQFLRKVALIFVVGVVIFAGLYPLIVKNDFSWAFSASLVLIISLGTFFQYYFGLGYQLLLEADQKNFIVSLVAITNTFFNMLISVICIKAGMGIHLVKLCSAMVYCSTPIILHMFVIRKYGLNTNATPDTESISKKWDAFGMQIANFVNNNTDIIVASFFLDLREVSVYTVYFLAINGIKKIVNRLCMGVEAALGKTLVQNDPIKLDVRFSQFEFLLNSICIVAFSSLLILIVPFVSLYTIGINDVNYVRYSFAIIACLAEMFYCLRLAYTFMVQAKGAFRETKKQYYIEAGLNIVISVILVNYIGLVGIAIGTLIAMIYRTMSFANYVYKDILVKTIGLFYKRMVVTLLNIAMNCLIWNTFLSTASIDSYITWAVHAMEVVALSVITCLILSLIFYRNQLIIFFRTITGRICKK